MVMDREASSWALVAVQEMLRVLENVYTRPSVIFKPTLKKNGPLWQVSYGTLVALGSCPNDAMAEFNRLWHENSSMKKGDT